MKQKIFSLLLIFTISFVQTGFAQKEKTAIEVKKMIWPTKDVAEKYKATEAQKKDQSAVILYQKKYYNYKKKNKFAFREQYYRRRIQLLDQAAVKEYSDFEYDDEKYKEYWGDQGTNKIKGIRYFNVKIIKPDGREIKIDVKKHTVKEDDVKKLAIPNLEKGDIVDYYYYHYKRLKAPMGYDFPSVETALVSDYPIVKYDVDINLERTFYFNFKNLNGAPDLKPAKTSNPKQKRYMLSMENIQPKKAKYWIFPYLAYPTIKFQVHFIPNSSLKKYANGFISKEKGVVKKSVSKEEVLNFYKNKYHFSSYVRSSVNKNKKIKEEILKKYEDIRFRSLILYIPAIESGIKYFNFAKMTYAQDLTKPSDFFAYMADYLRGKKIKYEMVVVKKRPFGGIDDLILAENLHMVMKIFLPGNEVMYLQSFNLSPLNGIAGEIHPYFEGNSAYSMTSKSRKFNSIKKVSLPVTTKDDNTLTRQTTVSFDQGFDKISYQSKLIASGHKKDVRDYYVRPYQYLDSDFKRYEVRQFYEFGSKSTRKENKKRYEAYKNKAKKEHLKKLKEFTEDRNEIKIDNYKLVVDNFGRYHDKPNLELTETYTITDGLTKKAGRNILFQAGKLIGKQIHIDKKEMERTEDIYKDYASTTQNIITINIPEGYTVKGLDKFNKSVTNETGSFVSSAKQDGNKIIITVKESYNKIFEPNKNWQKLVDILNTSYQFNQEKLLFKK